MKRMLSVLAALMCTLSLTACDGGTAAVSRPSETLPTSSVPEQDSAPSSPSPSSNPTSSGVSSQEEETAERLSTMSKRTAFYAPRQASCVYTVSLDGLDTDTVTMLRSLQGLIARYDSAALYLIGGESDVFWKNYVSNEMGVYFQSTTVENLLSRYSSLIDGVVIYTSGTFEYETAFHLATDSDCLIATEPVARRYALTSLGHVTDVRNAYPSKQAAYEQILSDAGQRWEYLYLSGEGSAFADYAYATGALMLNLDAAVEWERVMLEALLSREGWELPAVAFAEQTTDGLVTLLSGYGFGALEVRGLANATVLSSVTTSKKYTPRRPSVGAAGTEGAAYVSFLIPSGSLGDTVNADYTVWSTQNGKIPVSYELPLALAELAPTVALWYSSAAADSSRLVARGWTDIDQKSMPYEIYRKWHTVNNTLMSSVGLDLVSTPSLREDTVYGESYGGASTAAGIFVTDGSGEGSVWLSEKTPVIVSVNIKSLPALDAFLSSLTVQRRPQYYLISVSGAVFSEPFTYETADAPGELKTIRLSDVLLEHTSRQDVSIQSVPAENLMRSGYLSYSADSDRP